MSHIVNPITIVNPIPSPATLQSHRTSSHKLQHLKSESKFPIYFSPLTVISSPKLTKERPKPFCKQIHFAKCIAKLQTLF